MIWIGLTGGLASGKSTVGEILKKKNIPVINADVLAREAVARATPGLKAVTAYFGPEILTPDGDLDRKKLAAKVFGHKSSLEALENIIHPVVRKLAQDERKKLAAEGNSVAFYDVPLLFEKNMQSMFDQTVVVITSEENQMKRAILRDKSNEKDVKARLAHQIPLEKKKLLADYVIENNSDIKALEANVELILKKITKPKNSQGSK